jgi:hypothetical protein
MKFMQGIMAGLWIISTKWLSDSLVAGTVLTEEDYEVWLFLLSMWLFFFTYALLAVVYVSHVVDRFFYTPCL